MSRLPWTFLWRIQSSKPNKDRKKKKKRNSQRTNTDRGKKSNDTWGSKRRRFCNSSFSLSETEELKVELFCWCVILSHLAATMDTEEKSDRWGKERTWWYLLCGMMQSTPPHPLHPPHPTPAPPPHTNRLEFFSTMYGWIFRFLGWYFRENRSEHAERLKRTLILVEKQKTKQLKHVFQVVLIR